MKALTTLLDALRSNPLIGLGIVAAVLAAHLLLQHRSRMQRNADEHLAALRREKGSQYTGQRRLR